MRQLFLALAMLVMCSVGAKALEQATATIDTVSSTMTIVGLTLSSSTPTSVIVSTAMLYRQVCVQNFDTSAFVACSENPGVSTMTANVAIGTIIAPAATATQPATPLCFSVVAGKNFYCMTSSITGTTRIGTTRGR